MLKNYEKGSCLHLFSGPHFRPLLVLFRNLKHFLERFFWVSVGSGFGPDLGVVFGVNSRSFGGAFLMLSLPTCASEKCGLDMVFTVCAAHGHVGKLVKKYPKMVSKFEVHFGTLGDSFGDPFWERFGIPLGSLGASLWEKRGSRKASKK